MALRYEKVYKYFVHDCLKILLLAFTSLKLHRNSKNDQFFLEKRKNSALVLPYSIGVTFSSFTQNSASSNIPNLGLSDNSPELNMSESFEILKYVANVNSIEPGPS